MLEEDGYPFYRRRDLKVQEVKGKFTYDNKSKAIKYLFKYFNKGPDRATFVIQENVQKVAHGQPEKVVAVDEIKNYLNYRYLAPCEAVWRLFSFDIYYSYPSVMELNFYLEDQHAITLRDSQNLLALLNREDIKITMFTEWFELNKHDPTAKELTYAEIPKYYVWHEDSIKSCVGGMMVNFGFFDGLEMEALVKSWRLIMEMEYLLEKFRHHHHLFIRVDEMSCLDDEWMKRRRQ
ncbi:hypothetical protein Tco_0227728 [Tanacetum coccineum]